jgi:hypothetical protein
VGILKTLRIELNERDYKRFVETTEKLGITIEVALRKAVNDWTKERKLIFNDPIFRNKSKKTGTRTKSSNLDEELYRKY